MNNTVVNIDNNFFLGDQIVCPDEIIDVAGVLVWSRRMTL